MNDSETVAFYRLWSKVHRPEAGCWTWRDSAPGVKGGYHQIAVGRHPETGNAIHKIASRFVFEAEWGGPLPRGMEVAHICNNPGCVKPSHLIGATRVQNERMKDAYRLPENRRCTSTPKRGPV